jgi:molybdopterin converting factor subunit 1
MPTVRVLLFASYADALGTSSIDVELGSASTVRDVLASVRLRAGASRLPPAPLVAVNESYASLDQAVTEHDEVAIIPPVAGG